RVRVSDLQGKPRAAEVSLAAVDDSVFAFGEDNLASLADVFGDPHPTQRFRRKAWRGSLGSRVRPEAGEQLKQLARVQEMQDAAVADLKTAVERMRPDVETNRPLLPLPGEKPVGVMPLGRLRSDFRETAAWLPQLRT